MAIINLGDTIFFAHKTGGAGEYAEALGEMSLELAIWLEKKYYDQKLAQQANRPDNTLNITDPDEVNRKRIQSNKELANLDARCKLSSYKHYKPALSTDLGHLSPLGLNKAQQAMAVIKDINERSNDLAYRPDLWDDADDLLIRATIPVRSLTTLRIITKAIRDAENRVKGTTTDDLPDLVREIQESSIKRVKDSIVTGNPTFPEFHQVEDFKRQLAKPEQDFNVVLLKVGQDVTQENRPILQGFVPTALIRQKAKTDLNYLFKFGLIGLGAYRDGSLGRPKHIIFPAKPGIKVIDHLIQLGHLY